MNSMSDNGDRTALTLTADEQSMIDYALLWIHWGGGSAEEIFLRFGLVSSEYFKQLENLLPKANLNSPVTRELTRICRTRRGASGHHTLPGHESG